MKNIVLIGMPASGKSTVARLIEKKYGMKMIDGDTLIENTTGKKLCEIIASVGNDGFLKIEEEVLSSIQAENSVIAPGGSCIYEPLAMEHLRSVANVFHLYAGYEEIEKRIGDVTKRGVVLPAGMTLLDLYNERIPLNDRYAHFVIDTQGLTEDCVAEKILKIHTENLTQNV